MEPKVIILKGQAGVLGCTCIKISVQEQKCQKCFFINVWRKNIFDIHFTEFGAVMTTVLPVLFKYCYKGCLIDWLVFNANHSINQPLHTQTLFRMGRMWVPRVIAGGGHRHEQIDIHIIYIYKHNILFRYPANFRYYDI
jgi:hypothetical protein